MCVRDVVDVVLVIVGDGLVCWVWVVVVCELDVVVERELGVEWFW